MQLAYGGVFDYHGSASTGMVGYSAAREMRRTEYRLGMTLVPLRGVSGCGDCPSHVVVPPAGPSGVLLGTGGGGLFGWEMRRGLLGSLRGFLPAVSSPPGEPFPWVRTIPVPRGAAEGAVLVPIVPAPGSVRFNVSKPVVWFEF